MIFGKTLSICDLNFLQSLSAFVGPSLLEQSSVPIRLLFALVKTQKTHCHIVAQLTTKPQTEGPAIWPLQSHRP